jgi:hypothetical protein
MNKKIGEKRLHFFHLRGLCVLSEAGVRPIHPLYAKAESEASERA